MAKTKTQDLADQIKRSNYISEHPLEFISTGSTMFNLALSGKGSAGGWARGRVGNIVGDGGSGKTVVAVESCAFCHYNIKKIKSLQYPEVKNVSIVYNNVEGVLDLPIVNMYGESFLKAVEWTRTPTIEEFGRDFTRRCEALKDGDFLFYVVDSFDALKGTEELERFYEAAEKEEKEEGSYNLEKQKYASKFFSGICDVSSGKDATLLIVSQVRDKIGVTFGKKQYRAGGKALNFYTHQVAWIAEAKKIPKTYHGEERILGIKSKVNIERNKTALPFRKAEFTILFNYGLDDISSMTDWLYGPEVKKIKFDDMDFSRAEFIDYIEKEGLEEDLQYLSEEKWQEIENAVAPKRKGRFA